MVLRMLVIPAYARMTFHFLRRSTYYAAAFGFVVGALCDALLLLLADEAAASLLSCGTTAG